MKDATITEKVPQYGDGSVSGIIEKAYIITRKRDHV
jgi:hypothetical protein